MKKTSLPPAFGLLVGIIAVSTASTFIRLAQVTVPSLAVAAWRLTFATLILTPAALFHKREEWRQLTRREWGLVLLSGLVLAVHFYAWITSLALTSVAASVVLVTTNPLFVALISHFFFQERLTRRMVAGMLVAFTGSALIGLADAGEGTHQLWGDLLALGGALAVAAYMLTGRRLRARLSLLGYIYPVYGTAAVTLMGVSLLAGVRMGGYGSRAWLWLILVALIPQVIGHSAFNWALGHVSATYVALTVLAEPVGSTLLAWLILGEPPTLATVLGGLLILGGILVATRK